MVNQETINNINTGEIAKVLSNALKLIDGRLVEHGERVAYITYKLYQGGALSGEISWDKLFLLSLFHDIGAYKTEEIDRMLQFETTDVWDHAIYGYCFLKNMTPLGDDSEAILYHHLTYPELMKTHSRYKDYAALICLSDRLDILIQALPSASNERYMKMLGNSRFSPRFTAVFNDLNRDNSLRDELVSGAFKQTVDHLIYQKNLISVKDALNYLRMLIYSIDFRSEHTVTHSVNTTALSVEIARRMGLSKEELDKIYVGALLHDIGKISTPVDILEAPGKLTPEQMVIMREHVSMTETIITGLVNDEICKIACRHHEKLDGSGYPRGLTAQDLTTPQRIVAVADIISALTNSRSYKDAFSKDRTLSILTQMKENGQLDPDICNMVAESFDSIMQETDPSRDSAITLYHTVTSDYQRLQKELHS